MSRACDVVSGVVVRSSVLENQVTSHFNAHFIKKKNRSFEVLALAAGYMSTAALAAHTILAQIVPLAFMIPLGIGTAVSVRIGNNVK